MSRRIIVNGYHPKYKIKLLEDAKNYYGSLRKVAFALGIATSVIYRWYNNETEMGQQWAKNLEDILKKVSAIR
jgi:DNA invertase Pin-like site-specific DNA recombinase